MAGAERILPAMPATADSMRILEPTWGDRFSCAWSAGSCWFMSGMLVMAWWWARTLDQGR